MTSEEHTFLGAIHTERVFVVKIEKQKKKWKRMRSVEWKV